MLAGVLRPAWGRLPRFDIGSANGQYRRNWADRGTSREGSFAAQCRRFPETSFSGHLDRVLILGYIAALAASAPHAPTG